MCIRFSYDGIYTPANPAVSTVGDTPLSPRLLSETRLGGSVTTDLKNKQTPPTKSFARKHNYRNQLSCSASPTTVLYLLLPGIIV